MLNTKRRRLLLLSSLMVLAIPLSGILILLGRFNTNDGQTSSESGPLLAWVNQQVVLEHDWHEADGSCPWAESDSSFEVNYVIVDGQGQLISGFGTKVGDTESEALVVQVLVDPSQNIANADCISRVVLESAEGGSILVSAWATRMLGDTSYSKSAHFDIFYLKFESATTDIVNDIPVSGEIFYSDDDP